MRPHHFRSGRHIAAALAGLSAVALAAAAPSSALAADEPTVTILAASSPASEGAALTLRPAGQTGLPSTPTAGLVPTRLTTPISSQVLAVRKFDGTSYAPGTTGTATLFRVDGAGVTQPAQGTTSGSVSAGPVTVDATTGRLVSSAALLAPVIARSGVYRAAVKVGSGATNHYFFRVQSASPTGSVLSAAEGGNEACLRYGRDDNTSGYWLPAPHFRDLNFGAWDAGATVVNAQAAMSSADTAARTKAVDRTLKSIRDLVDPATVPCGAMPTGTKTSRSPSQEPVAAGGYTAQYELWASAMFVIAKQTPEVWANLQPRERKVIDKIMEAELVANAFITSPTTWGQSLKNLDGDLDTHRAGNYREGLLGQMLLAAAYFGPAEAAAKLDSWQLSTFIAEIESLQANDWADRDASKKPLQNILTTFKTRPPYVTTGAGSAPPTATEIQDALHAGWSFGTDATGAPLTLNKPLALYEKLVKTVFSERVTCGVDSALATNPASPQGIATWLGTQTIYGGATYQPGLVADPLVTPANTTGCTAVQNLWWTDPVTNRKPVGMVIEFNTSDGASGVDSPRSSASYAIMSFKADLAIQVALLSAGLLPMGEQSATQAEPGGPATIDLASLVDRKNVGANDLFKKLNTGYVSYSRGGLDDVAGHTSDPVLRYVIGTGDTSPELVGAGGLNPKYRRSFHFMQRLWIDTVCGSVTHTVSSSSVGSGPLCELDLIRQKQPSAPLYD